MSGMPTNTGSTGGGQMSLSQLISSLNQPAQMGASGANSGMGMQQFKQPAFTQPASSANASNTTAVYPQLTGGYWNQMAQALAGPQYVPGGTSAAGGTPNMSGGLPGRSVGMPIRGLGIGSQR